MVKYLRYTSDNLSIPRLYKRVERATLSEFQKNRTGHFSKDKANKHMKKMFKITNHLGNANQNVRDTLIPVRAGIIRRTGREGASTLLVGTNPGSATKRLRR